ncbi:MAG: tyrosine-type recombinase/integrase [Rhodobacterales bacterium]|nr:tyrosine-type recombinase/integrase [Rhodobacterales bacterium]
MTKRNLENERIKRAYFNYLRDAKGKDETTLDKVAAAIMRYEQTTGFKSFKQFNPEHAGRFKKHMAKAKTERTGTPLAKATIDAILRMVKAFIEWLACQNGYKSRISYTDAAYFNNNAKDARVAHARREIPYPSMEQCDHAFSQMPSATLIEKRNRAGFALLMLTGARDSALTSLRLKHVDLIEKQVSQDAREVRTKNSKTFYTWFFPVDEMYLACFTEWVTMQRKDMLFGPDDAVFPKPKIEVVKDVGFQTTGLTGEIYANANAFREIIKGAFVNAGIRPFVPHSFRKTLVKFGDRICGTREQFKAWSMNLGHDSIDTTLTSYLQISVERQGELIKALK